ncbi:alpha/beta hydrolase [Pseudohoeflea coraliihabitans]|uniref:Alpha/beta hydrolase n=1 Tax=Pseudohoeflea coraliihabitans TaxID=2860393 RepID=A0ABS6WU63_9HYPH|nr:alpha/beta fold hydrolase [Pseudohoeflea sp. DP4N28-3]MBW3098595.1 alpha/beta hydrolase [Pseudohoeflea sp. DP4N28-3]
MSFLSTFLVGVVIAGGAYFIAGAVLAASQTPSAPSAKKGEGLQFGHLPALDTRTVPAPETFRAGDGAELVYRRWPGESARSPALILLHGSTWHGRQFWHLAAQLAAQGIEVIVPDLRGHGEAPHKRGDVGHIGQLEDDIADLVAHLGLKAGERKLVIGGHSSGGGLTVRFAGGPHASLADGFVLLAPYLGYRAPTARPHSGNWAYPATRRIIGLSMLNAAGVHHLDHLPVIAFAVPDLVRRSPLGKTVTDTYSHRLLTSYSPRRDYTADLAAIDRPLLLIAGAEDEAFHADQFEPTISAHTATGRYHLIDGENHLGIVDNEQTAPLIADWLKEHF